MSIITLRFIMVSDYEASGKKFDNKIKVYSRLCFHKVEVKDRRCYCFYSLLAVLSKLIACLLSCDVCNN